jgi:hypothetical protein
MHPSRRGAMADDSEDDEIEGYVSEALGPAIECGVKISAKAYITRMSLPEGHGSYPPGDYISAYTTIIAEVGNLAPLRWALLPVSYWGLEDSSDWENVKAGWREQFQSIGQSLVKKTPDVLMPVVKSAVREVEIDHVDFDDSALDGSLKIKRGPKKKRVAITDTSKRRWRQFIAALPEYRDKWQKARDSEDARDGLPDDLLDAIGKPGKRARYKPYQVALIHLARDYKVLGLGSEFLRARNWKTVEREMERFQRMVRDK